MTKRKIANDPRDVLRSSDRWATGLQIYGVGINDSDFLTSKGIYDNGKWQVVWNCPYYRTWRNMLERCYSNNYQEKHPTYKGCTVDERWHRFSVFREWMKCQDFIGKHLDKDLLAKGNKVYSPETCVFVPSRVNIFLLERGESRGTWPLGVSRCRGDNKFKSTVSDGAGRNKSLGYFDTPEEAHQAYLKGKAEVCIELISDLLKEGEDTRIIQALHQRYIEGILDYKLPFC